QLRTLDQRWRTLQNLPLLPDDARNQVAALGERIHTRLAGADAATGVADALQNILTHANTAAELKATLEAFTTKFPDDPRTAEFKIALLQLPAADALESWQQLLATYQ